eukprot:Opistho-1_new@93417
MRPVHAADGVLTSLQPRLTPFPARVGMNAAVRAVVRVAMYNNVDAYAIYEGYQGMVDGGDLIRKMNWEDAAGILSQGGTVIGTARCKAFRERPGRLIAAKNLIKHGINSLVVIGGDGSLTGANLFKKEWRGYVEELLATGQVTQEEADVVGDFNIVGLVGSIDNDMSGTDITIGADTAMNRIIEAVDAIQSTAASHKRSFVLEVMGRNCGFLALMSAIACGADWVFIPESPPDVDDWESVMCAEICKGREQGKRMSIVIVSEGARDRKGNPITSNYVRSVLEKRLDHDTRVTVLGHVQRGGNPSAFDRILATVMGEAAARTVLHTDPSANPVVIGVRGTKTVYVDLVESVKMTQEVPQAIQACNYDRAMHLRGDYFKEDFEILKRVNCIECTDPLSLNGKEPLNFLLLHCGAPAAGMNAAARAAVRIGIHSGHTVYGVKDGFEGLATGKLDKMSWASVNTWMDKGGAELGTNRTQPSAAGLDAIAANMRSKQIQGVIAIGGFEAYTGLLELVRARDKYSEFCVPMTLLPATISNNVPGTEFSIGSDTALNNIVRCIDVLKQSASSSRRRVFVVETHGGFCGYLASLGALATGAEICYTAEEGISLHKLQEDILFLMSRFKEGATCGMVLRNEKAQDTYSTQVIHDILEAEGKDYFTTRINVLGHLQQGLTPSPLDRIRGVKLATMCISELCKQAHASAAQNGGVVRTTSKDSAVIAGLRGTDIQFKSLIDLVEETDFKHRRPKEEWWAGMNKLMKVLAKHNYRSTLKDAKH